jgi:phosphate transport system substrate-binding protein
MPLGVTIQGCGATFPEPLYKRWFLEFYKLHPDVRTNYLGIGSGAGVRQLSEGLVDFGASDEALTKKKLAEVEQALSRREGKQVELLQMPMTAGSVAICYNLPGNPELKLTREAYLRAVLGDLTSWDDEEVARANPGLQLPHQPITFVRRAESSGTTFNFTNHLHATAQEWAQEKGASAEQRRIGEMWLEKIGQPGKSVPWVVGIGGKGTSGVAALIQQTPGALGYIESGYAELTALPMATLQNRAGQFVKPTTASSRVALEEARFDAVYGATVPGPKGKDAYPIVTFTWIICRKHYDNPQLGEKLRELLLFCLTAGQRPYGPDARAPLPEELGYVPLPDKVEKEMQKVVGQINR